MLMQLIANSVYSHIAVATAAADRLRVCGTGRDVCDGQYFFCTYSPALANIMYAVIIINKHV